MVPVIITTALLSSVQTPLSSPTGREWHVSTRGDDANPGTSDRPLRTISAAAQAAYPGDTVLVRGGVYREQVSPARGGTATARITYQAAPGERVQIKGSEVVKGWRRLGNGVWKVEIPNSLFGSFNPFADQIGGDWFDPRGRTHHTGAVYLNGDWLTEAQSLAEVLAPEPPRWVTRLTEGYLLNLAWLRAGGPRATAETFDPSPGPRLAASDEGGQCLGWIEDGDGASAVVDFGEGSAFLEARVAAEALGGEIEVRLDGRKGRRIAQFEVPNTGGWQAWRTLRVPIRRTSGQREVWIAFHGPERRNTNPNLWYARVGEKSTEVWARFGKSDPNRDEVEVNVRQTVFYPDEPGIDYITVRGFEMSQAATPWAPPTAEQKAVIGTHWSRGWIIEDNRIHHSICAGISLGKYGDEFDNTSMDTAEGYVETIKRAHAFRIPWTRERIGHHIVRRNEIWACEQVGIVGSMGAAFSEITDNTIRDIHTRMYFHGAEVAGIKFHGAVDTLIARNRVFRTFQGLWLDWMTQGTLVSRNLFYDNLAVDVWVEVNHGPFIFEENAFLSEASLRDWSQGGAFVANIFGGRIDARDELGRSTPYLMPHSTEVKGMSVTYGGDHRFVGNIFLRGGLGVYARMPQPLTAVGNIYLNDAAPSAADVGALSGLGEMSVRPAPLGVSLRGRGWSRVRSLMSPEIGPETLPPTLVSRLPFTDRDGQPWARESGRWESVFGPNLLRP